ncbi:hypothetical protein ACTXI4_13365 [Glutamicibacter ardleyensis]|uniref:hypothetical protein n=1 Tax=Glutamicibacter ardleyensis TaxID=225894 RepID=UPI003FD630CE
MINASSGATLLATNISNAGLGNRMRFTLSALSLATSAGRDFCYAWPQTNMFQPPLTDLWQFEHAEITWAEAIEAAKSHPYTAKSEELKTEDSFWHLRSGDPLTLPAGAQTWFERLRGLTPSEAIRERVDASFDELRGAPYVGVSIRAHEQSHARTKEASPVSWYLNRMAEIVAQFPNMKFFISCDVPEVQDQIMAAYPTSVGLTDKGEYNSAEGVIASVVDLYLMASSSYMIVPYWSSFPIMAWELAGRRITMETSRAGQREIDIAEIPLVLDPLHPSHRSGIF